MDIFCLVIWILNLIIAVSEVVNNRPINPVVSICAMFVCIVLYLARVVE